MKKSRFSEAKMISVLLRNERGEKVSDLCREIGISDATFCWKAKYGGLSVSELKGIKELETGNARLKKMYTRILLGARGVKGRRFKKALGPDEKRMLADHMIEEHAVSVRQGCRAVRMARSTYRYERRPKDDDELIAGINRYKSVELVGEATGLQTTPFCA